MTLGCLNPHTCVQVRAIFYVFSNPELTNCIRQWLPGCRPVRSKAVVVTIYAPGTGCRDGWEESPVTTEAEESGRFPYICPLKYPTDVSLLQELQPKARQVGISAYLEMAPFNVGGQERLGCDCDGWLGRDPMASSPLCADPKEAPVLARRGASWEVMEKETEKEMTHRLI